MMSSLSDCLPVAPCKFWPVLPSPDHMKSFLNEKSSLHYSRYVSRKSPKEFATFPIFVFRYTYICYEGLSQIRIKHPLIAVGIHNYTHQLRHSQRTIWIPKVGGGWNGVFFRRRDWLCWLLLSVIPIHPCAWKCERLKDPKWYSTFKFIICKPLMVGGWCFERRKSWKSVIYQIYFFCKIICI